MIWQRRSSHLSNWHPASQWNFRTWICPCWGLWWMLARSSKRRRRRPSCWQPLVRDRMEVWQDSLATCSIQFDLSWRGGNKLSQYNANGLVSKVESWTFALLPCNADGMELVRLSSLSHVNTWWVTACDGGAKDHHCREKMADRFHSMAMSFISVAVFFDVVFAICHVLYDFLWRFFWLHALFGTRPSDISTSNLITIFFGGEFSNGSVYTATLWEPLTSLPTQRKVWASLGLPNVSVRHPVLVRWWLLVASILMLALRVAWDGLLNFLLDLVFHCNSHFQQFLATSIQRFVFIGFRLAWTSAWFLETTSFSCGGFQSMCKRFFMIQQVLQFMWFQLSRCCALATSPHSRTLPDCDIVQFFKSDTFTWCHCISLEGIITRWIGRLQCRSTGWGEQS